jgi:excisionase family DNA binding protein
LSQQTPQFINARTAAAILSVCPATISRMIRSGRLPASHPTGSRSIRLDLRDVLRLAEPVQTPTEETA